MASRSAVSMIGVKEDEPVLNCVRNLEPQSLFPKEKLSCLTFPDFYLVFILIGFEVCKQTSTFSLQKYNNGFYPIPSTLMVVFSETMKLLITIARLNSKLFQFCLGMELPGTI